MHALQGLESNYLEIQPSPGTVLAFLLINNAWLDTHGMPCARCGSSAKQQSRGIQQINEYHQKELARNRTSSS
jgi:hypothetical protein